MSRKEKNKAGKNRKPPKTTKLSDDQAVQVRGGSHVQFNPKEFKLDDKVTWKK